MSPKVGILALQGDFEAHFKALERLGAEPVEVRSAQQLESLDGLIIPGGESSTMLKLIEQEGLLEPLREFGRTKPHLRYLRRSHPARRQRAPPVAGFAGAHGYRR